MFCNAMTPATISSMAVSDCECQTFDWSILLVATGIFAWRLAQLLRGCSLLASMCLCGCQSKIIGQPQPVGQVAGAAPQTQTPGASGQTFAGAHGASGQTCHTCGQLEGPAAGAPGASGQTCQTFGQPKGQAASQTLGENDQTPGRGSNAVRKTEKKVYTTVQGKCYHMDPGCQHIRNRHAVVEKAPCGVCVCVCANMQCLPNFELDAKLPKSDKGWH